MDCLRPVGAAPIGRTNFEFEFEERYDCPDARVESISPLMVGRL